MFEVPTENSNILDLSAADVHTSILFLALEGIRMGGVNLTTSIFLVLNFCSLTDYQNLWHNCSLFVKTSFNPN